MFIDEIQELQCAGESLRTLGEVPEAEENAGLDALKNQLILLTHECPRYDVHNVYTTLFPPLLKGNTSFAVGRNASLIERRNHLIRLARKAPLGPPWLTFCLEHRANQHQRSAYLVRWDAELMKYTGTVMFDSLRVRGMVEFLPNAFEIFVTEDDTFSSSVLDASLRGDNLHCAEDAVQLVRTCVELLNWDREDVPTQTFVNPKANRKVSDTPVRKSAPTVIRFEPFLKAVIAGTHRSNTRSSYSDGCGQHLVRGHYQNFKFVKPRFGHKPVLGKTYGRLWVKPHKRGNPERHAVETPRAIFTLSGMESANQ